MKAKENKKKSENKNMRTKKLIKIAALTLGALILSSCVTIQVGNDDFPKRNISRQIADQGVMNSANLTAFFMSQNPDADKAQVSRMANFYIKEAGREGINHDVAFAQMCLETGFLRFGGLVTPEMHNYCGLGAMDAEHPGEVFPTEMMGVRAHIQHLHAYGTTADVELNGELIDKRYKWVNPRGKAPDVWGLAGTWASDRRYGEKLDSILSKMERF